MPKELRGAIVVKCLRGKAFVWAEAGEVYEIVRQGDFKGFKIASKRPVTVKVQPGDKASVRTNTGQTLLVEYVRDGFAHEEKIGAGNVHSLSEGRYSILLPPQK